MSRANSIADMATWAGIVILSYVLIRLARDFSKGRSCDYDMSIWNTRELCSDLIRSTMT